MVFAFVQKEPKEKVSVKERHYYNNSYNSNYSGYYDSYYSYPYYRNYEDYYYGFYEKEFIAFLSIFLIYHSAIIIPFLLQVLEDFMILEKVEIICF